MSSGFAGHQHPGSPVYQGTRHSGATVCMFLVNADSAAGPQVNGPPVGAQGLAHTGTLEVTCTRAPGAPARGTARARTIARRWRRSTSATGASGMAELC